MKTLLVLAAAALADDPYVDLGPMVGHAGADEARIWIKASGAARFSVRYSEQENLGEGRDADAVALTDASDFMGHVRLTGLRPSTRVFYAVLLDGKVATERPYPSFVTAPPAGKPSAFRFAFGSCVGREGADAAACWGEMAARGRIDFLLLLGDNHYADSTDPAKQRAAYASHRRPAGYREVTRRTPTWAIWDDHDYGPNNSDGTTRGKEDSLRVFKEVWANPAYGEADNPGVYFSFAWGDVDFLMLDSRYYRTPNLKPEDGTKTMLGSRQLAWLKRGLAESKGSLKFVACGSEWQTHSQPDCWVSFLRERDDILGFIEDRKIKGVIFLSGDRHFTAAYQIRGRFLEVTSGPMGSRNAVPREQPEMFLKHVEGRLYTVFDVDTTGPQPKAALEVYRAGQGIVETRPFTWDEINGVTRIPPLPPAPPKK
jgi:alkaline phosphatase D